MSSHTASMTGTSRSHAPGVAAPILVATDGRGAEEFVAARMLAAAAKTEVIVVTALHPLVFMPPATEFAPIPYEVEEARREAVVGRVRQRIEEILGRGVQWPVEAEYGFTAEAIVRAAHAHGAGLIIMGRGRDPGALPLLGGETVLRVARRAPCPVLAVAGEWRSLPATALAAVDFSPSSVWAAEAAMPLLADAATLLVTHVWERSSETTPQLLERDAMFGLQLDALLERAATGLHRSGTVRITPVSLEGRPVQRLLEFAAGHHVDLIVTGRSGHNAFERLLLGSVTTGLLRGSACSVLIVPEPPLAEAERLSRLVRGGFESTHREAWVVELEGFARRNAGRRTILEVDDPAIGAQVQERGYLLLGATFDVDDRRAELMFGAQDGRTTHLTRSIGDVRSIAELTDPTGRDVALRIAHGAGQTLLTFLPDGRPEGR